MLRLPFGTIFFELEVLKEDEMAKMYRVTRRNLWRVSPRAKGVKPKWPGAARVVGRIDTSPHGKQYDYAGKR